MTAQLQQRVESTRLDADKIAARSSGIYETVLAESKHLDGGDFRNIHADDLKRLFGEYDRTFFDKEVRGVLGDTRLEFRLSKRMTSAGGKTTRFTPRRGSGPVYYEIAVSTTLLLQTFLDGDRPITVSGLVCRDRLEALQRVFEHELLHLVEMLIWTKSSCSRRRFQSMAANLFGHTEHTHALITPRERAFATHGIRAGSNVRFRFDGAEHVGIVNRITKRATVLVEDRKGTRYSNGKRYSKFYVPVTALGVVE